MTQPTDITLSNQPGASYRAEHNDINQGFGSTHQGPSEPSYVVSGMLWIDDSVSPWVLKFYDGTTSNAMLELDPVSNNIKVINHGDGTALTGVANIGQIQNGEFTNLTGVAGTNTITANASPSLGSYIAGQLFSFIVAVTNTGAVTINIDGQGATAILQDGFPLVAGDLVAGVSNLIYYDGTQFQLLTGASAGGLTAVVDDPAPLLGGNLGLNGNGITYPSAVTIVNCFDQDDLASDSATATATQQSIKAYVDNASNPLGQAKAWVNFSATSGIITVRNSFNVSSVNINTTGDYTVNFINSFPNSDYAVAGFTGNGSAISPSTDFGPFHGSSSQFSAGFHRFRTGGNFPFITMIYFGS